MMPKRSLDPKEIISLLSKLKSETPEYPVDLLEARKAAFLKQAATLKIEGKGDGGQDGGSSGTGGSGPALGGGTAAQSFLLQALVGFSVVAALLLTAFAYREQIGEILKDRSQVVAIVETETMPALSTDTLTMTPGMTGSPIIGTPSPTDTGLEAINLDSTGGVITIIDGTVFVDGVMIGATPTGTKTNSGLHLGQTPGTPAAPGQGNPGNQNQPEKTDKPDNPNKPDTPTKAPKDDKPTKTE